MLFNSFEFAVFFPVVAALYFLLDPRWRWVLLLIASYWFYMAWRAEYAVLLVVSTIVDYTASRGIAGSEDPRTRKRWLLFSILTNLGILGFFKYFNFLNGTLRSVVGAAGGHWPVQDTDVLLPMGISFYTFQTMSYTIDVYRRVLQPTRHLGRFALYVTFFPQLVAGPIERAPNLLPQFFRDHDFDQARVIRGLKQMLWGFFKKLVIADRLGLIVDPIYDAPRQHDGPTLVLATFLFALQIYCDFSAYSDIAIGAARVLGHDLMENFRTPYLSSSIREFWSRWHISLSTWFRDYLYIPLGGNRVLKWRWYFNLFVVFLVSGLWHGANWTFVLWGALHGAFLVAALIFAPLWERFNAVTGLARRPGWRQAVNVPATFVLVLLSWVLFRARTIDAAGWILHEMMDLRTGLEGLRHTLFDHAPVMALTSLLFAMGFLVFDPLIDDLVKGRRAAPRPVQYVFYGAVMAACLLFGHFGNTAFIYFQF
ncbi:MAG: MBOAT family protein [Flavobacteriales bacterium]|nr:MBOAT family protein [Flavobacteriales bacterium]MCB9193627.1 MBOAT family protein [Flavobacteriales bacterium]